MVPESAASTTAKSQPQPQPQACSIDRGTFERQFKAMRDSHSSPTYARGSDSGIRNLDELINRGESEHFTSWRWLVLLALSFNSAMNAFMMMNFAPVSSLTEAVFEIEDGGCNWL